MQTANKKWFVACLFLIVLTVLILMVQEPVAYYQGSIRREENVVSFEIKINKTNWRGLTEKQRNTLSTLGKILYLDAEYPSIPSNKNYTILIWNHGKSLEARHLYRYSKKRLPPFWNCPVNNCQLTYLGSDLATADLVLFHLHRTRGVSELPKAARNPNQLWTFLTDESPFHTFLYNKNNAMKNYNGIFNWSMTYRMDSDIPVPYGRTVLSSNRIEQFDFDKWNNNKRQDVLIAIMGSNCGGSNHRWKYVAELKKHIKVDVYGHCGTLKCPGHFTKDCSEISRYKFYLSFENSNCDEYITEKLWWNAYTKESVPIVMGGSKLIYKQLLPPGSYINVEDFALPRDLANYIIYLNSTSAELQSYFAWKTSFAVVNEHGYFGSNSFHYCRICQALNYNKKDYKVYNNLEKFWGKNDCKHSSWDIRY